MQRIVQNPSQFRQQAEGKLERKPLIFVQPIPGEELLHELLHELGVHQIELEMQNESLQQSQLELEISRDRYVELYDFAPVGYLTLNHEAMIDEVNLTAAALLGVERSKLIRRRFAPFVVPADRDRWHRHFLSVLKGNDKQNCELSIHNGAESDFHAMLYCQRLHNDGQDAVVRIVLADISDLKSSLPLQGEG